VYIEMGLYTSLLSELVFRRVLW